MEEKPYPGMDMIVAYLRSGRKTFAACGRACDFFTEEMIPGEYCGMTDGVFSWISSLAYYVEKYNLRLSQEFERHVHESQMEWKDGVSGLNKGEDL